MLNLLTQLLELLLFPAGILLLILLAFFISTLLHELGHAIPVLFMTRGKVQVFIGSRAGTTGTLQFRVGRLQMFIKYNPLLWINGGACKPPQETLPVNKQILYIATGPLTSLALALTCWYLVRTYIVDGIEHFIFIMLLYAAAVHTLSTAVPMRYKKRDADGRERFSDGALILRLLKVRHLPGDYFLAAEYLVSKNYHDAAVLLDNLLAAGHTDINIYRLVIAARIYLNNIEKASDANEAMKTKYALTFKADDYCNEAVILLRLNRPEEALQCFQKTLELDQNHIIALNNHSYALCTINRDTEAIPYLNKAIGLRPAFAYAYNNRGWAKIKLGQLEEGFEDVSHSLKLDPDNGFAYRNLGLYHLKKGVADKAIELLEKAKGIDATIPLVDEYLAEASLISNS